MHPILLQTDSFILPTWHFFYVLGALAALGLLHWLNSFWHIFLSPQQLAGFYTCSYCGGYLGARCLSICLEQRHLLGSWLDFWLLLSTWGPMTFFGGVLGAWASAILLTQLTARLQPARPSGATSRSLWRNLVDLGLPCGLLGLAFGRLGCFFNGDDYGILAAGDPPPWWAVTFANHPLPQPRVPVQLLESALVASTLMVGIPWGRALRHHWGPGACGYSFLAAYACQRFWLEELRGDPRGWVIEGYLSPSQAISLLLLLGLIPTLWHNRRRHVQAGQKAVMPL